MARAGLNRKSAMATATLVLAAEMPDIDVVTELGGPVFAFAHHRGITHSFVGVPLVSALVLGILWIAWRVRHRGGRRAADDPPRWTLLFGLGCLAGLSHILLDYTNSYGVRPFPPFSYRWYSWDIVFIVEPLLWVFLLGGLLLPKLFALIDTEVGARSRRPRGRTSAVIALALVVAFWGFRDYEHRRALAAMQALTYDGEDAIRMSAYGIPITPFRWFSVVETRNFYQVMEVDSLRPEVDPNDRALIRYKSPETPVTLAAKKSYLGRVYLDWAQYPVTEVEELQAPRSGYVVRFFDLRYLNPENPRQRPLSGWVQLDRSLNVVTQSVGVRDYPGRKLVGD
jgi:inner membrane protein